MPKLDTRSAPSAISDECSVTFPTLTLPPSGSVLSPIDHTRPAMKSAKK